MLGLRSSLCSALVKASSQKTKKTRSVFVLLLYVLIHHRDIHYQISLYPLVSAQWQLLLC